MPGPHRSSQIPKLGDASFGDARDLSPIRVLTGGVGRALEGQLTVTVLPSTLHLNDWRGCVAGPWTTEPSLMENWLP
jgi:hypothetical protein